MTYFTNADAPGRVRHGESYWAVGVLDSPASGTPIGEAWEIGHTHDGAAVWKLRVQGADLAGRFIIEDGVFKPVELVRA